MIWIFVSLKSTALEIHKFDMHSSYLSVYYVLFGRILALY